jgi:adenine-specific DNA-methyltransferase
MAARRSKGGSGPASPPKEPAVYRHPEAESLLRPDVGIQAQFRKKKPPARYRYDSSLSPSLDWDGQNPSRELGEWLLRQIEEAAALDAPHQFPEPRSIPWRGGRVEVRGLRDAVDQLRSLGKPFLDWAGKAERISFDVPTLPLFVHERLSTKAILETLKGHKRDKQLSLDLFSDPQTPIHDQVLRAYEYPDKWVNRMILGDSLVVMNSLLHYESLGGQVQMIYMDPPYGVKFGSNFQPFVRRRDVSHNDDEDMTREPEMVKAYRDTWELGLHSYLTYLRDRLLLARDLLAPSGSVFVQISDENLHHVRELMDDVFGAENICAQIFFHKTSYATSDLVPAIGDYLLWYARDVERLKEKINKVFVSRAPSAADLSTYYLEAPDGSVRRINSDELANPATIPEDHRLLESRDLASAGAGAGTVSIPFEGREYHPGATRHWKTSPDKMQRVIAAGRVFASESSLQYKRYTTDFPWTELTNAWSDTIVGSFHESRLYVVQTSPKVVERCVLMATDPGDLVLDPTCGSGTTAYVAEQWGRRWITVDASRVPLALARQRLLTATFPFYQLEEPTRGPAGGFVYRRKQNRRGEEVGGIVPHVTMKGIANDEPPKEEVLVDRPEQASGVTRVTGPFCFEATIPTPVDFDADGVEDSGVPQEAHGSYVDRMLEVLRKSPVLHVGGGKTVVLRNIRPPAKTLSLSAEAIVPIPENGTSAGGASLSRDATLDDTSQPLIDDGESLADPTRSGREPIRGKNVAIVFGPESGAISEKLVFEAAREAHAKSYAHLYVIGFAIQPNARELVEKCEAVVGVPATYVQATPDLMMGDLLKNMRSSQIFSVCGLPEIAIHAAAPEKKGDPGRFQVELRGLDVFDPITMETEHRAGNDVPAWFLDTDYNGLCFHVCQAFFPRTAAWDDLRRSLRGQFEDSVWDHLAGTTSAPFEAGEYGEIAVKVIDDRGNELLVVRPLSKGSA